MLSFTILGLAFAGLSSARDTVSLYIPGADNMDLVASIITSDQSSTIYAVQCGKDTDASDCGIGAGIVLTQGPRTAAYTMSDGTQDGANSVLLL